jgi:hypothetical protein
MRFAYNGNEKETIMTTVKQTNEQLEWDLQCYGCSEEQLRNSLINIKDYVMCAASLMSDAQQEIEFEMYENARQTINRAKFVLFNFVNNDE